MVSPPPVAYVAENRLGGQDVAHRRAIALRIAHRRNQSAVAPRCGRTPLETPAAPRSRRCDSVPNSIPGSSTKRAAEMRPFVFSTAELRSTHVLEFVEHVTTTAGSRFGSDKISDVIPVVL